MLSFFPTPYPDETWYSILCRYHMRSGNLIPTITVRELFHGKDIANMSSLCPSNTIYEVLSQLPDGTMDYDDMILNHTLFKYATRFMRQEEKKMYLETMKDGTVNFPGKISKEIQEISELKICPLCKQEDIKKYGEPYWHLSHQIPLASICPKHRCRLQKYNFSHKELNRKFVLPDFQKAENVDYNILPYEEPLTETVIKYQYMPLEAGPTEGHNNLHTGIFNAGYGVVRKSKDYMFNLKKICSDLCGFYGTDVVKKYFLDTNIDTHIMNYIRLWRYKSPERYALVATLIKQDAEDTFSEIPLKNNLYEKFIELSKTPTCKSMKYIANELGVKPEHLNFLASNLNVKPFWNSNKTETEKKVLMPIAITVEERSQIHEYAKSHGFVFSSNFVLYCVRQVMNGVGDGLS